MAFAPIFIVGVPRSGTTLLRVLLDSHSQIAGLPETPWLLGAYGPDPSLRGALQGLIEGRYGAVRNVKGVESDHVVAAGRVFLGAMFEPMLRARGKRVLAFKTPADIRHLDFLLKLAPDAFYIHITRDGRDVAMSQLAKRGSFFDDLKEYRRIGFANLLQRWAEWEGRIRALLYRDGVRVVHVKYEDLIADPARELQRITAFLGVPFETGMLDYASLDHDYPSWEAGSTDVAGREGVSGASAGKWRHTRITAEMLHALMKHDPLLVELGYEPSGVSSHPARRALAGTYQLISPVLDVAARVRLLLRPLLKTRARLFACLGLALLTGQFLIPGSWPQIRDLTADTYQPIGWFAAALGFFWAFGPALLRRSHGAHPLAETFLRCWACMAIAAGVLELAQDLVPDRHAAGTDFLFNVAAAALAVLVGLAFLRGRDSASQPNPAHAKATALTA